jgi:phosphomannomutase
MHMFWWNCWLQVAVGCDPRVSGPLLMPAVLAGLQSAGAAAVDVGLSTTPAMFYGIIAPGARSSYDEP